MEAIAGNMVARSISTTPDNQGWTFRINAESGCIVNHLRWRRVREASDVQQLVMMHDHYATLSCFSCSCKVLRHKCAHKSYMPVRHTSICTTHYTAQTSLLCQCKNCKRILAEMDMLDAFAQPRQPSPGVARACGQHTQAGEIATLRAVMALQVDIPDACVYESLTMFTQVQERTQCQAAQIHEIRSWHCQSFRRTRRHHR